MPLDHDEAHAVETAERVSSVFSVLGAFFIIGTFVFDRRFRKPINRLVFYASWGNLFANVATLISRSGIILGVESPLCQFQALLIQWFMPADALWTLAMACNVYLTFFRQYDASALRSLEWKYVAFCYGLPFIPALTYCFIETAERGRLYGSANLWCWVSTDWNVFRMATFYGPVWIIIITNVIIYIRVGTVVLKWRRQLLSLNRPPTITGNGRRSYAPRASVPMSDGRPSSNAKTYEVSIVSQVPHRPQHDSKHLSVASPTIPSPSHPRFPSNHPTTDDVTHVRRTTIIHPISLSGTNRIVDVNRATMSYCYTALLFFIALLVTWVPSTVNRLFGIIRPNASSPFALDFASGLVLPLQGFWNTVIYVVTSYAACKALLGDVGDLVRIRSNSAGNESEKHGIPSRMTRQAESLHSGDTTDRESNAHTKPKYGHDSKSSHTLTEAIAKSPRKSESRDSGLKSPRADIVISFDGKRRVVHHDSRSSVLEPNYNPFEPKQVQHYSQEWVPPPDLNNDDEENLTKFYESASVSRTSLHFDSASDDAEVDVHSEKGRDDKEGDPKIGYAR